MSTLMFKLKPPFQKKIFKKFSDSFGGSIKGAKILGIPASSIRGYKNLYFDSVPSVLIMKLINLKVISEGEVKLNTLLGFLKEELVSRLLKHGRDFRHKQLKGWAGQIPSLSEIMADHSLNLKSWFLSHKKLIDFGVLKIISIKEDNNFLIVNYSAHSNGKKKLFTNNLPSSIVLDEGFSYFFGLWCGDHSGGGRVGICNQDREILRFTEDFLLKYRQRIEKILYITKSVKEPVLSYDKKFVIDKEIKGWAISAHSINGFLSSFFHYLLKNLESLLKHLNKKAFFAGLFDAEGNVSFYNRSFRWACKDKELVRIYSGYLKKLKLFDGYDGGNLLAYNREAFESIIPFMKHSLKRLHARFLVDGSGEIPNSLLELIVTVDNFPGISQKGLAKALKKSKVYSELKLLRNFGFVKISNYPYKYWITNKSRNYLRRKKL